MELKFEPKLSLLPDDGGLYMPNDVLIGKLIRFAIFNFIKYVYIRYNS